MLDAIVIGAGAAGLAAAGELSRAGASFVLLEARERLGGRIWTRRVAGRAVELGAEFVHGRPEATWRELKRAGLKPLRVPSNGGDREDFWSDIEAVLGQLSPSTPDRSFREAVRGLPRTNPRQIERVSGFVQSFHAADLSRVSANDVAQEGSSLVEEAFRLRKGYGALVSFLAKGVGRGAILKSAVVSEIRWGAGRVHVLFRYHGKPREIAARSAVVTLPLGVLKAKEGSPRAVRFSPRLPARKHEALGCLEMGSVAKAGLLFKPGFWRTLSRRARDTFLHDPGAEFPVFWTARPLLTPLVTAWAGGPPAARLCARGEEAVVAAALRGLGGLLSLGEGEARAGLRKAFFHDWSADPFSRGAYSYVSAGGSWAREEMARPIEDTLYFAGEAYDARGHSATVEGALRSGQEAARRLLAML